MTSVEIADLDIKDIVKEVNPYSKRKKAYILLDRKFAEDPVDGSYLKWHFDKKNLLANATSSSNMGDIISIRFLDGHIPMYTDDPSPSNDSRRLHVNIVEFEGDSISGTDEKKFHFAGRGDPALVSSTPRLFANYFYPHECVVDDEYLRDNFSNERGTTGVYEFRTYIKHIETLTLKFRMISSTIDRTYLPQYVFRLTSTTIGSGGSTITVVEQSNAGNFNFDAIIKFTGITTSNTSADSTFISLLNRERGWKVTYGASSIYTISDYETQENYNETLVNLTTLTTTGVIDLSGARAYIELFRLRAHLEVTYLEN